MNYRDNFRWARFAPLLLLIGVGATVLAVPARPAMADVIKYEWQGTILPREAGADPWDIGDAGRPFVISATVDENAVDFDVDIGDARFSRFDAELLIDGIPPTSLTGGSISFRELATADIVSIFLDEVQFNGVTEPLIAAVVLPTPTFAFAAILESPPFFLPAITTSGGAAITDASSYRASVDMGATVTATVIPEPSSLLLMFLAILGVSVLSWRTRTRMSVK